ncbi:MAG: hypothetical protein GY819_14595 [Planctomycetaceae bacterium]|nr:hypothetical protein [Planctomycetaceae bacterium]
MITMRAIPDKRQTVHRTRPPELASDTSIYASFFNNLQPYSKLSDFSGTQIFGFLVLQQAMGCIADRLRFWETY